VLCPNLDIHKSNEVVVVTKESKVNNTYLSIVLATKDGMTC